MSFLGLKEVISNLEQGIAPSSVDILTVQATAMCNLSDSLYQLNLSMMPQVLVERILGLVAVGLAKAQYILQDDAKLALAYLDGLALVNFCVRNSVYLNQYARYDIRMVASMQSSEIVDMSNAIREGFNPYGNGQSRRRDWRRVTHRAYLFDESDPATVKFDEGDAQRFVRTVQDHPVVQKLGDDKIVRLMMKRRGVKPSVAFKITIDCYNRRHVVPSIPDVHDIEDRFIPRNEAFDWSLPVGQAVWALADGVALNRRQRKLLKLAPVEVINDVVKKSGIIKGMVNAVTPDVTLKMDEATATRVDALAGSFNNISDSVKGAAKVVEKVGTDTVEQVSALRASVTEVKDKLTGFVDGFSPKISIEYVCSVFGIDAGSNPLILKVVKVIRDIVVAWSVEGIGATLAVTTLIAEANQNSTYAVLLTGCVAIMKQFTQWCDMDLVEKKAGGDYKLSASFFEPLIKLLGGAVFGVYNNIPKINGLFTFAKNINSSVEYLVHAAKLAINAIYRAATGYDLFELPLDACKRRLTLFMKNISLGLTSEKLDHDIVVSIKSQLAAMRTELVKAQSHLITKDDFNKFNSFVRTATEAISRLGVEVENVAGRAKPVVIALYGRTGVGKTSVVDLIATAVGKALNWPGSRENWHSVYKLSTSSDGFQPMLPAQCRSVQVDEPFVNNDSTEVAKEVTQFLHLISSAPMQMEGPAIEDKNTFIRPSLVFLTYNTINPKTGTVNPEAVNRRVDFKFELVPNTNDLYKEISFSKLDELLSFDCSQQSFSFTQVASAIVERARTYTAGSARMDVVKAEILDKFDAVKGVEVPPPKSLLPDGINRRRYQKTPKPSIDSDCSDEEFLDVVEDVDKKAKFVAGHFWNSLGLDMEIEEANLALEDLPDFVIDGSEQSCADCSKHIFKRKIDDRHDLIKSLRSTFGAKLRSTDGYYTYTGGPCVFDEESNWCIVHNMLRCKIFARKSEKAEKARVKVDDVAVWSYLLETGKYIGEKIFDVAYFAFGVGALLTSFLFPFLLFVGFNVLVGLVAFMMIELFARILLWLFPSLDNRPQQKAYGNQYAVQVHTDQVVPRFVPETEVAAVERKGDYVIAAKDGIPEALFQTCQRVLTPVQFVYKNDTGHAFCRVQLHAIAGRLCKTVKHAFTYSDKRPELMVMPAPWNKTVAVKATDGYSDEDSFLVQTIYHKIADVTFVVLPIGLNAFPNIKNRYMTASDFNTSLMNNMALYYKQFVELTLRDDGSVTCVEKPMHLMSLPNGCFKALSTFNYTDGTKAFGAEFSNCPEPSDGVCGGAVIPLNPRFGGGGRVFGFIYTGHSKRREAAFCAYVLQEDIDMILELYPNINAKVEIRDHTGLELKSVVASFDKKAAVAVAPRPGFVPSDAGIYPSKVFNSLTNTTFSDRGKEFKIPPVARVPSAVREIEAGFSKYPVVINHTAQHLRGDLIMAAKDVANTRINAVRGYPYRRREFLTVDEALNGTSDGQVEPLNMDSSAGYSGVYKGRRNDKYEFCDVGADGRKSLKPQFVEEAERIFDGILKGVFYYSYSKTTSKGELRPVGKVVRLVSSQHFLVLLAARRIFAPVQAMTAYGAPRNGTARAIDPTGPDGEILWEHITAFKNRFCGDAKQFDASQRSEIAALILPIIWSMEMRFVYPDLSPSQSELIANVLVLISQLAYEVVGPDVYLHIDGTISGTLLTTDRNDDVTATAVRMSWIKFYRRNQLEGGMFETFHKMVRYASQGDDLAGSTSANFGNYDLKEGYADVGIRYTTASKDLVESQFDDDVEFLKREPIVFRGHIVGRLPLVVIHEIMSYIRTRIMSSEDATLVNVDAAFRELFFYGEEAYEKCRDLINVKLASENCKTFDMTFEDMLQTWSNKFTTSVTRVPLKPTVKIVDGDQTAAGVIDDFFVVKKSGYQQVTRLIVEETTNAGDSVYSRDSVKNRVASQIESRTDSTTRVETDGSDRSVATPTLKEMVGLTVNSDTTGKSVTKYGSTTVKILGSLDPYPDQQVQKILSRQYPVGSFQWAAGDPEGFLLWYALAPDVLFGIPKIADTLSAFRYFTGMVLFTFRATTSPFHMGRIAIRALPLSGTPNWRNRFETVLNSPHVNLSAQSQSTAEILVPWVCPKNMRDLQNAGEVGYGGIVEAYVHHALDAASATAPDPMEITVYAQFIDPIVAGLDLTSAPAVDVVMKSGISEAYTKSVNGVLAGVASATSTVEGLLAPVGELASAITSVLDKPMTVAAPIPVTQRQGSDMVSTRGLFQGVVLGSDPKAMVSVDPYIMGNSDPMGKLKEIIQRPGMVAKGKINVLDPVGTIVFDVPVKPNFVYSPDTDEYTPHSLGYYSQFFRYWRGGLKYYLIISSSIMMTTRWRIAFYPDATAFGAAIPANNKLGDITTALLAIKGDKEEAFEIPWIGSTEYKAIESFGEDHTNTESSIGRLVCWVESIPVGVPGMATTANISFTLYVSGAEDMQFLMPDAWEDGYEPDFSDPGDIRKKCDIVQVFSQKFPSFVPVTKVVERGLCSPDRVESVVELLKRFELMSTTATSIAGTQVNAGPDGWPLTSWHFWLIAPFLTWRGGSNYKIVKSDFSAPTCNWFAAAWQMSAGATLQSTLSGRLFQHIAVNPILEWNLPFYDQVHCREVFPNLSEMPIAPKMVLSSDGSDASELYAAVADDFTLGQYIGPPPVTYTAPPVMSRISRGPVKRLPGISRFKRSGVSTSSVDTASKESATPSSALVAQRGSLSRR